MSSDITGTGNINITGNISLSGTVDSRDLQTDGTKLDGIDASATANPITNASNDRILTSSVKAINAESDFQFDANVFIPNEIRHIRSRY